MASRLESVARGNTATLVPAALVGCKFHSLGTTYIIVVPWRMMSQQCAVVASYNGVCYALFSTMDAHLSLSSQLIVDIAALHCAFLQLASWLQKLCGQSISSSESVLRKKAMTYIAYTT